MKMCGFEKSMAFFSSILVVLIISGGVRGFTVIRSSKVHGYRDPDRFSNPYCRPFDCRHIYRGTAGCSTSNCCYCQCNHNNPNYVIYSRRCVPNDEVDEDCELFVPPVDAPLFVADMTKPGKIPFRGDVCSYSLTVQRWSYRMTDLHWHTGSPNNFRTEPSLEDFNSWSLLWDRGLDAKYSGLILRFHFTCRGAAKGCLLVKMKGNYTLPDSGLPSPPLRPTDVLVDVTGRKINQTLDGGVSSGKNGGEKNTAQTPAQMKRELEQKKTGIVVAGVTISLAAGIVLVFATLLLRMKKQESAKMPPQRRPHNPNAAYEEPIDSNAQKGHAAAGTVNFHNAFYTSGCVLSITEPSTESTETKMTRPMGPLPPLPGEEEEEEGIYEEPVIKRNVNYQGLAANENQQTAEPNGDAVSSVEQTRPPVYNVLERSVDGDDDDDDDDDDYDDNVAACRKPDDDAVSSVEQKRPPVYNVPVERSVDEDDDQDDDDDYDDNVAEFRRTTTV